MNIETPRKKKKRRDFLFLKPYTLPPPTLPSETHDSSFDHPGLPLTFLLKYKLDETGRRRGLGTTSQSKDNSAMTPRN